MIFLKWLPSSCFQLGCSGFPCVRFNVCVPFLTQGWGGVYVCLSEKMQLVSMLCYDWGMGVCAIVCGLLSMGGSIFAQGCTNAQQLLCINFCLCVVSIFAQGCFVVWQNTQLRLSVAKRKTRLTLAG